MTKVCALPKEGNFRDIVQNLIPFCCILATIELLKLPIGKTFKIHPSTKLRERNPKWYELVDFVYKPGI